MTKTDLLLLKVDIEESINTFNKKCDILGCPNEKIIIETKEVDIIEIIEESEIDTSNWWIPDVYESSFYTTNGWEHLFFKEIKDLRYE